MNGALSPATDCGLSLGQAAREFGLSLRTLGRWVRQEEVPAHKVRGVRGLEWRIQPEDLQRFLDARRETSS